MPNSTIGLMPSPTPADSVMPIDWSIRPSSSIATQSEVKSLPVPSVRYEPPNSSGRQQPEQAEVAHLGDQLDREVVVAVPGRDVRRDLGLGEVAHDLAERLVIFGQLEAHRPEDSAAATATLEWLSPAVPE